MNALAPGPFRTPLNDGIDDDPHVRRFLHAEVPMRRWAAPEELTGAALLLTDPQSTYITGAVLPVDGGWTSHLPGNASSSELSRRGCRGVRGSA